MPERESEILICVSDALRDGEKGVGFPVATRFGPVTAFAVRFELDWQPGEFFDRAGLYFVCATHGALYQPESGRCQGGPCSGRSLRPIAVIERGSVVYWLSYSHVLPGAPMAG